jgi:predicted TIM-barrel fold metal-dependent hydrolase
MICDVHAHYTPKNFSAFMGDRFASPVHLPVKRGMALHPFSDSPEDIEGRFRLMDEAGVGRQVLSPNHPPYLPDEAECVTAVKMLNDAYAEFAHRYPDRISSYVMLPLAAYRCVAEGDGARLRPAGLRRRQRRRSAAAR